MGQAFDALGASPAERLDDLSEPEGDGVTGWPSLVEPTRLVPLLTPESSRWANGASATAGDWPPPGWIPSAPPTRSTSGAPATSVGQNSEVPVRSPSEQAQWAQRYAVFDTAADGLEQHIDRRVRAIGIFSDSTGREQAPPQAMDATLVAEDEPTYLPPPTDASKPSPARDVSPGWLGMLLGPRASAFVPTSGDPRDQPYPATAVAPASTNGATEDLDDQFVYEMGGVPAPAAKQILEGASAIGSDVYRGVRDAPRQIVGGAADFANNVVHFADDIVRYGEEHGLPNVYFQLFDNKGNWAPRIMSPTEFREAQRRGETDIFQVPTTSDPDSVTGNILRMGTTFALGRGALAKSGTLPANAGASFVSGLLMDPSKERLSNVIDRVAPNFLTDWLKADPSEQNRLLVRLKSGLEFAGYDVAANGIAALFAKTKDLFGAQPRSVLPARFGNAASSDYRTTFLNAYPHLDGRVVVHHAVEQQVLRKFPGMVTEAEIHSLENLRGIPIGLASKLHLSQIRKEWNRFYNPFLKSKTRPTRQQLLQKATEIDAKFGAHFLPPVGGAQ